MRGRASSVLAEAGAASPTALGIAATTRNQEASPLMPFLKTLGTALAMNILVLLVLSVHSELV
eukprot:2964609-Pleurochrysis_carterae.AAC.1